MSPERRTIDPFRVAGILGRTTNAAEASGEGIIGGLWQTFGERASEIGDAGPPCGVYHDYESDHHGAYSLLVGPRVPDDAPLPDGWHGVAVPGGEYLVFPAEGEMPMAIIEAWQRIWGWFDDTRDVERAFTVDFESYGAKTEIHIAIRPRQGR